MTFSSSTNIPIVIEKPAQLVIGYLMYVIGYLMYELVNCKYKYLKMFENDVRLL